MLLESEFHSFAIRLPPFGPKILKLESVDGKCIRVMFRHDLYLYAYRKKTNMSASVLFTMISILSST